jgi:hypothetical protein
VRSLGNGFILSSFCPSFKSRPFPDAPRNHGDMRRRDESSSALGGRRARFGASLGAANTEASSRSHLLSRVGRVGGVSAALMASSPLAGLPLGFRMVKWIRTASSQSLSHTLRWNWYCSQTSQFPRSRPVGRRHWGLLPKPG